MTEKKISGFTATNIVVANMIGTGVFTSLGFQAASIHSDVALIALWIFGGVAALCGALCYAELAAAIPRSGGEYRFLSRIFHLAGVQTGAAFQNISTIVKLALIFAFILAGFLLPEKQPLQLVPTGSDLATFFSGPFAVSMFYVMYTYSGWNAASYITE